jgi:hypothetical protein
VGPPGRKPLGDSREGPAGEHSGGCSRKGFLGLTPYWKPPVGTPWRGPHGWGLLHGPLGSDQLQRPLDDNPWREPTGGPWLGTPFPGRASCRVPHRANNIKGHPGGDPPGADTLEGIPLKNTPWTGLSGGCSWRIPLLGVHL